MMSELTGKSRRARSSDPEPAEPPEPPAPVDADVAPEDDAAPTFRVALDEAATLPSRKPLTSWSELETSAVVESPADDLFGAPDEKPKSRSRSSLGAAFAEFDAEPPAAAATAEPSRAVEVTHTYDEPIGPPVKPPGSQTPRRERSAATIASLLTEALAAYQSGTEEEEATPPAPALDPFDSFLRDSAHGAHRAEPGPSEGTGGRADSGFRGRHRTPE